MIWLTKLTLEITMRTARTAGRRVLFITKMPSRRATQAASLRVRAAAIKTSDINGSDGELL
eukprot:7768819-Karenia_brevis.AAC.1